MRWQAEFLLVEVPASAHGSHGYSARGPYAVKVAFVVWRLALGSSAPRRDSESVHVCAAER
jgi:hypothetical protein